MSKTKYKVGDKVRVRSDLKAGEYYNMCLAVSKMEEFSGKNVTIEKVNDYDELARYKIKEDPLNYWWSDDMFDPIQHEDKLVIICRDGRETVARYYRDKELICSAGATRSREDAYDFFTGARFALDRANKYSKLLGIKPVFNPETDLKDGMFVLINNPIHGKHVAVVCGDYFVMYNGFLTQKNTDEIMQVIKAYCFLEAENGGEILYEKSK